MCPTKNFKVSAGMEPWITNKLLEEIRDKDLALKKARKSRKDGDWVIQGTNITEWDVWLK